MDNGLAGHAGAELHRDVRFSWLYEKSVIRNNGPLTYYVFVRGGGSVGLEKLIEKIGEN